MNKLTKIIYVSSVGASFVVLMVRNKNLPIGEGISSKDSRILKL